jgi:hypothetical protein
MATTHRFFFFNPALHPALLNPRIPCPRQCPPAYTFALGTWHADMLQHRLYTYSNWSGELENWSGGDRVERMPTTERVRGIPLPNQIWAETPRIHQTKPHPRNSPRSLKRRRCQDTRSMQDKDRGQVRLRIDRNSHLEVQDGPGSQQSRPTDRQHRK